MKNNFKESKFSSDLKRNDQIKGLNSGDLEAMKRRNSDMSDTSSTASTLIFEDDDRFLTKKDKILLAAYTVVFIIAIVLFMQFNGMEKMGDLFVWVDNHPGLGIIAHLSLILGFSLLGLPGSTVVYVAGGILFRPFYVGLLVNAFGVLLGCIVVTIMSIKVWGEWTRKMLRSTRKLYNLTIVIKESGFWMTVWVRFVIPFYAASYLFPHLEVDPYAYMVGTLFSMIFHIVPDTIIGSLLSNVAQITSKEPQDNRLRFSIALVTILIVISVCTLIGAWCDSALELVQGSKMISPMSFSKVPRSKRVFCLWIHIALIISLVVGMSLIWTLPKFRAW